LGFLLGGPAGKPEPPAMRAVVALGPLQDLSFFPPLLKVANQQQVIDRFVRAGPAGTLRRTLGSAYSQKDGFESVLRPIGVEDAASLLAQDSAGASCAIAVASSVPLQTSGRQLTAFAQIAAHIAGADRLRRRGQPDPESFASDCEAILS